MPSIAPPAHTRRLTTTDDWITPKWIIDRLGPFTLDPCASDSQPWPCAMAHFTKAVDGLSQKWFGEVWLNPPYGRETTRWLAKLAQHGFGTALIFARTETKMFFDHVWPKASALMFLQGRLVFCRPDGTPAEHNSGGPSVLIAYGDVSARRLQANQDMGAFVSLSPPKADKPRQQTLNQARDSARFWPEEEEGESCS